MRYSKIIGVGSYLPAHVLTNKEWEKHVNTSDEWIKERTGIHSRHIASKDETASSMATTAASRALEFAKLSPQDVDLVIVATATPDKVFPATACLVQKNLSIPTCIAFDVQAACTGFIYAMSIADQFIKTGMAKRALVIGSELMSRVIDWSDRDTCILFGDGAGAFVLERSETPGIHTTRLYAEGKYDKLLSLENVQTRDFSTLLPHLNATENFNVPADGMYPFIKMDGRKVYKIAVTKFAEMAQEMLKINQLDEQQLDWIVPHQANIRIIQAMAEKLGVSMDKVICTLDTHSNTSSASIPLAFDVAVRDHRIQRGQTVLFEAFGAGLTWGSALVTF